VHVTILKHFAQAQRNYTALNGH